MRTNPDAIFRNKTETKEFILLVKIAMFLTFFCQGLYTSMPGLSYLYLKDYQTHAMITNFQVMDSGGYLIAVIGSILLGRYLPRRHFPIFFALVLLFIGSSTAGVPYTKKFQEKLILSGFSGILKGGLDSVTHVYSLNIWEQNLDPTFQTFYCGRAIGTFLAPVIIMEYMRIHSNNTYKFEFLDDEGRMSTYPYMVMTQFHLWVAAAWIIIYGFTRCGNYKFPDTDKPALVQAPCCSFTAFALSSTSVLAFISISVEIGYEQVLAHISYDEVQNFDFYAIHPFHIFNLCGLVGRVCATFLAYKFNPFRILVTGALIFIIAAIIEYVFTWTRNAGAIFLDGLVNFGASVLLPSSLSFLRMHIVINFEKLAGVLFGVGVAAIVMPHSLEEILHAGKRFIPFMVIAFSFLYLLIVIIQAVVFCKLLKSNSRPEEESRRDSDLDNAWEIIKLYSSPTSADDDRIVSKRNDQENNSRNKDNKQIDIMETLTRLRKDISELNDSARRAIEETTYTLK